MGVPNAITRLAHADLKSTLAVSIHAPNQALREQIIPSAKAYPIDALVKVSQVAFVCWLLHRVEAQQHALRDAEGDVCYSGYGT